MSSDGFERPTGSGLHDILLSLHPAHGKLIPLRVVSVPYIRTINARFHYASVGLPLRQRIQIYFTPLSGVLFTFPSRYLFTIGLQEYLALGVSSPRFIRAIRVPNYSGTMAKELL